MPTRSVLADRGRLGSRRPAVRRRSGQARVRRIACQISFALTQTEVRPASTGHGGLSDCKDPALLLQLARSVDDQRSPPLLAKSATNSKNMRSQANSPVRHIWVPRRMRPPTWRRRNWTSGNRSPYADLCILRGSAAAAKGPCVHDPNGQSLVILPRTLLLAGGLVGGPTFCGEAFRPETRPGLICSGVKVGCAWVAGSDCVDPC